MKKQFLTTLAVLCITTAIWAQNNKTGEKPIMMMQGKNSSCKVAHTAPKPPAKQKEQVRTALRSHDKDRPQFYNEKNNEIANRIEQNRQHKRSTTPAPLTSSFPRKARVQNTAPGLRLDSITNRNSEGQTIEKSIYSYNSDGSLALSTYYLWDTAISDWIGDYKEEYAYDERGNLTMYTGYDWDAEISNWVGSDKEEYAYDTFGNQTMEADYDWDVEISNWVGNYKDEYAYDERGNLTMYTGYDWDAEISDWVVSDKEEYTYDTFGNKTMYTRYYWNTEISDWVVSDKEEYAYDTFGNKTMYTRYYWNAEISDWVASDKEEYAYDTFGNQTMYTVYYWNTEISDWAANYKYEYTYDTLGNQTMYAYYYWDTVVSDWVMSYKYKYEYTYDTLGNKTMEAYYNWNTVISDWVGYYKRESIYDSYGNQTMYAYYNWDTENSDWVANSKVESTYDLEHTFADLCSTFMFEFSIDNESNLPDEGESFTWDNADKKWNNTGITKYHYSALQGSGTPAIFDGSLVVYPNPASDILYIKTTDGVIPSIKIYSLAGALMLQTTGNTINVSALSPGMYTAEINGEKVKILKK